jgi:hypothetical protein
MHAANKSLIDRALMFRESISVQQRYFGYVPLQWVFAYTSYLLDRRDQFTRPIKPSVLKYSCSLPVGCWYNRSRLFRFIREWLGMSNVTNIL